MTTKAPQDTGIGEVDAEKQERDDGGSWRRTQELLMGKYPVQNTRALEWKEQSRDEGVGVGVGVGGNPIQQRNAM